MTAAATFPEDSRRLREALPRTLQLVLGYGAQGATASQAVRGFVRGPAGLEGGIVNASRSVLFPPDGHTADARGWETAFDEALKRATRELGDAVT